ncbi:PEST proteolytic signal-containing nuclear protein [Fukomys damarensis]|uniref:PEST proteolytic signal-containing nuclear protein n=1 Tax=Fukomys damarensis TaxID=885580 RepID=A0A091DJD7_FUKDA|nr:PEST proteolytic signal-containing nuclear protein [Fukomys damarensis]
MERKRSAEETVDLPTKPTIISKFGFGTGSQTTKKASAITIRLGSSQMNCSNSCSKNPFNKQHLLQKMKIVNQTEEMPPEAKMRMKNIGMDSPTSARPNSFNKGKYGFSDNQKL